MLAIIIESESDAAGTTWGLTDLHGSLVILVSLHNLANSLVVAHGNLAHKVLLLLLLLLTILVLSELLLLSVTIGRLIEGAGAISLEDVALVLRLVHLLHGLLLLLGHASTDNAHSLVVLLSVHLLLLLLGLRFFVASSERERRATAGRSEDARR